MKNYLVILLVIIAVTFDRIKMEYDDDYEAIDIYMCGVSQDERHTIVDLHNHFRWLIANGLVQGQPRGVNLKRIKWDIRLAEQAQYLTERAKFDLRVEPDDRFIFHATSQSVHLLMSTKKLPYHDWMQTLDSWFDEHLHYTFGSQDRSLLTSHYKQIVWANTSFVGCGACSYFDDFSSNTRPNYPYKTLMACNYGPPGNLCDFKGVLLDPYITNKTAGEKGCPDLCPSDELEEDFLVGDNFDEQLEMLD